MIPTTAAALAQRFFDSIEAGDVEAALACYATDAEIWHNTDEKLEDVRRNRRVLGGLVGATTHRRYTERRMSAFDGGFVQQHVLTATFHDGREARLPAVIVCRIAGDRITRLDEYFDGDAVRRFSGG